jgi:hypothetical protein
MNTSAELYRYVCPFGETRNVYRILVGTVPAIPIGNNIKGGSLREIVIFYLREGWVYFEVTAEWGVL